MDRTHTERTDVVRAGAIERELGIPVRVLLHHIDTGELRLVRDAGPGVWIQRSSFEAWCSRHASELGL